MSETVRAYYDEQVLKEWDRMNRNPVEFAVNREYLGRYCAHGDRVLDLGGGPGRYALFLAERGCDVTLCDLSARNAAFAAEKAREMGLPLRTLQGDAREADRLLHGPFDAVLLMGPLYHLTEEKDRERAVGACYSLLRPGGLIFASTITSHAGILYMLEHDLSLILAPEEQSYIARAAEGKPFGGMAFTEAYFMPVGELPPLMERGGFRAERLVASESVCGMHQKALLEAPPEIRQAWIDYALRVCERPENFGMAEHMLYIGRKR